MPKFRTLTGQFAAYIPDGPDPNITPDRLPMNGRALFTPIYTGGVIGFPGYVPPEFARPEPIPALVIDGEVRIQVGGGDFEEPTTQPLSLMVTVDDEATQEWSWKVDFSDMQVAGRDDYVDVPSMAFRVPEGGETIDLAELVPVGASTGINVTKGPRGAGLQTITAVDGQLVFTYTDSQEFTIPVPEAVQGPVGPEGPQGPAGLDGAEGPQGPKGDPGEIPELVIENISDATPVGRALVRATTEGAARSTLGLQAGATSIAGAYSELKPGSTQTNSRVWSPKNISDYVEYRVGARAATTVEHGENGATERPDGATLVVWVGSATPQNATKGDIWNEE